MSRPDQGLHGPEHNARGHLVGVADASRVLECSQLQRQLRFQHLVRHYMSQMLHGCKSAYCTTPTCLSCQKRTASRPVRPPTQLTARALAHYLAGQNDPQRGLCPHELNMLPASLEIQGATDTSLRPARRGDQQYGVYSKPLGSVGTSEHVEAPQQHVVDAVKERHQARMDAKSLSQNIYDSVTVIYAYSKQLPNPASIFHTLRSFNPLTPGAPASPSTFDTDSQTRARNSSRRVTSAALANADDVTPPVNMTTHTDHRQPQDRPQDHGHGQLSSTPLQVLSNGQHVHRIPFHPRESATVKSDSQSSLAEALDSPKASSPTAKRKASLNNHIHNIMGRTTSAPLPRTEAEKHLAPTAPADIMLPVLSTLNCSTLAELKDNVYTHRKDHLSDRLNSSVDYDTNRRFQASTPFVNRSLFYALSNTETLLESFHDSNQAFSESPLPHLDSARLTHSFGDWSRRNGALVYDSLCVALKALFTPPPELHVQKSPRPTPSRKGAPTACSTDKTHNITSSMSTHSRYLDNLEAAHIAMICIHALTSSVSAGWPHTWAQLRRLRAWGIILPNAPSSTDPFVHPYLEITDELEYEPAIRLAENLLRALGARTCFEHILATMEKQQGSQEDEAHSDTLMEIIVKHLIVVERVALARKQRMTPNNSASHDPGWTVTATLMEWLKTIITKRWDSKAEINKWSSVGTAVMLLNEMYPSRNALNLYEHMFEIPFFNERLDAVAEPVNFLSFEEQPNTFHILQYPALFPARYLVKYFRTINYTSMMKEFDHSTRMHHMKGLLDKFLREPHEWMILSRMKLTLKELLILDISRRQPLRDTFDQLWGLEKRALLKPLKVKMGHAEGEYGVDQGGVTYEFFRVVLSEAFSPHYGMFTVDPQTRMIWFQPSTLEPDWKFEMIGMLFSLAIYNGITLPVTFPLVLYHFLLSGETFFPSQIVPEESLTYIMDGWPDLAKNLRALLTWTDGDVGDVFVREYAFSYEAFGQRIDHNMEEPYIRPQQETPTTPAIRPEDILGLKTTEAKLVTNDNRQDFVKDYIHHLTCLSVLPQLRAFRKGFVACLQARSLGFFNPITLRNLIEGEHEISISKLRACATYDGYYSANHPTIQLFWHVVEQFDQKDCRQLLEFVTVSDRVPVTGYEGITFLIVPNTNEGELPSSHTCFGKLVLAPYTDEEVLREKLLLAIRNSVGFGLV